MSHYKPYPEYKDSGVEWIGEVPAHWGDTKLVRVFKEKGKDLTAQYPAGAISFGEVVTKEMRNEETLASYQALEEGEFIVNPLNLNYDLKSLRVALSDKDVRVSSGYIILRLCDGFQSRYVRWLMYLFDIRYMKTLGGGIRQTITFADIAKCHVAIPGCAEQSQIATFLDRETTRIDTLIEKKKRFIELLEEKRQAVITHAVTKGLDPNVPMKDSGVEWIGAVPAHWGVKRLGYVGDIFKGSGGNKSDQTEEGVPCLRYGEIYTRYDSFLEKPVNYVSAESASVYTPLQPGDIVFTASGEDLSEIGKAVAVIFDGPLVCGGDTIILRPRWHANHSTKFLGYLANAAPIAAQKSVSGTGFTVVHISGGKIKEVRLAWPQSGEQSQIATFLDRETARIDSLVDKTRESIELLKERRSALITAAVTGKIDVREEAA